MADLSIEGIRADELFERLMRDRVFRFRVVWAVLAILTIFVLLPVNWLAACLAGIGVSISARMIEKGVTKRSVCQPLTNPKLLTKEISKRENK